MQQCWEHPTFQLQPLKCWEFYIILGWLQYFKICPLYFFRSVEALEGSLSFYVSINGGKKQIHVENINRFVWASAQKESRWGCGYIFSCFYLFIYLFFNYFTFWFYTLSLDIQNFLFFFKMRFLIIQMLWTLWLFLIIHLLSMLNMSIVTFQLKNEKLEFKLKLYIEVRWATSQLVSQPSWE